MRARILALAAAVLTMILCATWAQAAPGTAADDTQGTRHTRLDPDAVRESVAYLKETYHVSDAEALRRLQLQADAQILDKKLRKERPGAYAGMWLDQDHGGVLRVLTTSDSAVAPYIRALADRSHVRTRTVAHSRAELDGIVSRLERTVGGGPDSLFIPAVSMMENKVVLWRRDWVADAKRSGTWNKLSNLRGRPAATAAARTDAVAHELARGRAGLAAQPRGLVEERRLDQPQQAFTPYVDWGYCHPLYCSTKYGPMRGGLRLNIKRDNGTWGGCTSGFNIRSKGGTTYNNWAWVLTAGHCVVGKTNNTYINHNGYSILQQHAPNAALEINSYPYDFVMLPYISGSYSQTWLDNFSGKNRVMKYCRNGGQDSDSDTPCGTQATTADQWITGYHNFSEINPGWVACATGTGSDSSNYPESYDSGAGDGYLVGTRCGKVISPKDGVGIWTDICARKGDSGGPLFSQIDKTAYGILEGSYQSRTGPCYSGEINNYVPISTIYHYTDNVAGATYRVITSSTG
ncbi:hypothetical protein [Streptomyces sp. NPDC001435]|uniref:hypothetical protein n=1 Tax=unclassified Streptomyces TaxID=2593676 RepID=UPI00369303F9